MALFFDDIAIDPSRAREGAWMDYMGGRFLLARQGAKYNEFLVENFNQHKALIESGTVEGNQKAIELYQEAFVHTMLLDWDGIVDKNRNPIPYSTELALQLVRDPRQTELVEALERFARTHANYQAMVEEQVADDVKSSAVS